MSVRFVLGRSGTGKTTLFLEEIRDKLKENPSGSPIIYLVPEQMTFLSEYHLVQKPDIQGMVRAQVYSFTRLAWRILQETGGISRTHLSSAGLNMLIRKIIEDKKEELKLFGRAADKTGFVQQVESMLTEFKRYCIEPNTLMLKKKELEEEQNNSQALIDKLNDLELIYSDFEEALLGKYVNSDDYLTLLADAIETSSYLQGAEIYIDGFDSFTPQEYLVIEKLLKASKRVSIALVLDRPYRNGHAHDLHLFRISGETYATLYDMALNNNVLVEDDIVLHHAYRYQNSSLQHLESKFEVRPINPFTEQTDIVLCEASNRRSEIESIAREIRELVRTGKYRFQDIAILVRNGQEYDHLIETIFFDYGIPFYIDQKRPMFTHPFIELLRSTLEILTSNWRYEPVFRAIKTELLYPLECNREEMREKMDQLENYVLAYGITGDKWTSKEKWTYRRLQGLELIPSPQTDEEKEIEREINDARNIVVTPLLTLAKRMQTAKTGVELCEALYLFLEELDIPAKLEKMQMEAEEKGHLIAAREHEQAWNASMDLLDELVEVLGTEKMNVKTFSMILDAGLEAMKFSLVPPAIDQVIVADLELSRLSKIKIAFLIGLNEGVMPAKMTGEGVLADEDRTRLINSGLTIAPDNKTRLLDEEFIAYRAFSTPSEKLYVSYPIADEEGKALMASPYVKRIKEMFPHIVEKNIVNDPSQLNEEDQLAYISHPKVTIAFITTMLQQKMRGYPIADFWWDVYHFYMQHTGWKREMKHILSSLFYQNKAEEISETISKQLYGEEILTSVSRMELFHSCPFSHFASHGLKLRERHIFRLEALDIGEMFHGALEWIGKEINRQNLTWDKLTKEQCHHLAKEAVAFLAPKIQNQILLSSNRHHYIRKKLEKIVSRVSYILSEHAKTSKFVPIGLEVDFGPNGTIPPLTIPLKNGAKMKLRGKIDRVDQAQNAEGVFLRVIDFKSSDKDLNLTEVYYGIALQMLTYLDLIITHAKSFIGTEAEPAGVLYFHLHNPLINSSKMLTIDQIEEEIFKSFRMKGLLLDDAKVVKLMDQSLKTGNSQVVSAGLKKDGNLSARSTVASKNDFSTLRKYIRKLYKKSGNQLVSGKVDIAPYKFKEQTPCQYCSFKPFCQFDQSLEANQYRIFKPQRPREIIELIRKEVENGENDDTN